MRGLLIAMMLLAVLPARAEERPTYDQIVRQFEAISFSSEYGGKTRQGRLSRWETVPVYILPLGVPAAAIEPVADEIRTLTGLDVALVQRGQLHNVSVSYGEKCSFANGTPTRITVQHHRMERCLYAELFQAVGPANDACHYRPSLFCDGEPNTQPTWADRIIMKVTFDKRLRDMTPQAEAMPIARQIIRELYDAGG
jgi:hypothetical protein